MPINIPGIQNTLKIYAVKQDKDGNVWVGTKYHGLWKSSDTNVFTRILLPGLALRSVTIIKIVTSPDGSILVATSQNGIFKSFDGISFKSISTIKYVISLFVDKKGTIWVGTNEEGLYYSTDGTTFSKVKSQIVPFLYCKRAPTLPT